MKYLDRMVEAHVMELFRHFPVVAVLGARQVGKTTLVENLPIANLKTVTFDPTRDLMGAREDPDLFLQHHPSPLFLDEVQYAPELLGSVKRAVDRDRRPGRFILSGSQNLAVLRTVSESLAGRVAVVRLLPLALAETEGRAAVPGILERVLFESGFDALACDCGSPRSAFSAIWRGGMPGLVDLPNRLVQDFFGSYVQTYIERDVRTAARIGELQTFGRFFSMLAALTAKEVNHNQLGRELGVDRKTAKSWTEIASATYQWIEVPAYSSNAVKRIAGKPKGYFSDPGLACALQHIATPDGVAGHPAVGALFETLVVLELLKRIAVWPAKPGVFHFRAHSGAEVDLLLELDGIVHPVEIKLTSNPTTRHCRSFASIEGVFPKARVGTGFVIASSDGVRKLRDDVVAVPWWAV
jgi:predicted AAA+ superfamily ATPase